MSTTKEHGVVMLATEDKTKLRLTRHRIPKYVFDWYPARAAAENYQHLYFTSDEEIKEGDWFLDDTMSPKNSLQDLEYELVGKIIATNDTKLNREIEGAKGESVTDIFPQIPTSFIESYVKNPVDKVLLEYEELLCPVTTEKCGVPCKSKSVCNTGLTLKLVNNEVVVASKFNPERVSEEELSKNRIEAYEPAIKLYTKDEVEIIALKAIKWANDLRCDIDRKAVFGGDSTKEVTELMDTDKWLEENL